MVKIVKFYFPADNVIFQVKLQYKHKGTKCGHETIHTDSLWTLNIHPGCLYLQVKLFLPFEFPFTIWCAELAYEVFSGRGIGGVVSEYAKLNKRLYQDCGKPGNSVRKDKNFNCHLVKVL